MKTKDAYQISGSLRLQVLSDVDNRRVFVRLENEQSRHWFTIELTPAEAAQVASALHCETMPDDGEEARGKVDDAHRRRIWEEALPTDCLNCDEGRICSSCAKKANQALYDAGFSDGLKAFKKSSDRVIDTLKVSVLNSLPATLAAFACDMLNEVTDHLSLWCPRHDANHVCGCEVCCHPEPDGTCSCKHELARMKSEREAKSGYRLL